MNNEKAPTHLKWTLIKTEKIADYKVFSVRKQRNRSPNSGKEGDFFVLDSRDWVNIIALTPENKIVLIQQYRPGTDEVTLEIPGGCVDKTDLTPLEAAKRELLEETGYSSQQWLSLGSYSPNPAIQSNHCHTFLALDVKPEKEQCLDSMEEISILLDDPTKIDRYIAEGSIRHGIIISAFYFYHLHQLKMGCQT